MPSFGKKASVWSEERAAREDEIWIKGFKEGETRVRFLQEPDDFVTYLEHYADGPGYFPCAKEAGDSYCVGCADPEPKTSQKSRKFAFCALDERGNLQVYKVGSRTHRQLQNKFQRLGTICDRDYVIVRSGKNFNEIQYDVEFGDKYDIEGIEEMQLYDIGQVLADKYAETAEAYGAPVSTAVVEHEPEHQAPAGRIAPRKATQAPPGQTEDGDGEGTGRIQPIKAAAPAKKAQPAKAVKAAPAKKAAAPQKAAPAKAIRVAQPAAEETPAEEAYSEEDAGAEAAAEEGYGEADEGQTAPEFTAEDYPDVDELSNEELRAYLSDPRRAIEFPSKAPRGRLTTLAKQWQAANPPF